MRELALGDVRLKPEDAMLSCTNNGKSVRLAAKEYQLMELFLRNPHQLLPKETILVRVVIQHFSKNTVISMVLGHPNSEITCIPPS